MEVGEEGDSYRYTVTTRMTDTSRGPSRPNTYQVGNQAGNYTMPYVLIVMASALPVASYAAVEAVNGLKCP